MSIKKSVEFVSTDLYLQAFLSVFIFHSQAAPESTHILQNLSL